MEIYVSDIRLAYEQIAKLEDVAERVKRRSAKSS